MLNSCDFRRTLKVAIAGLAILAMASFPAAGQTPADIVPHSTSSQIEEGAELNKGVAAYRSERYDEAIAHFQRATELEPNEPIAKLYLATALGQTVVPGLDTRSEEHTSELQSRP